MANSLINWMYEVRKNGNQCVRFYNSFALSINKAEALSYDGTTYVEIWKHFKLVDGHPVRLSSPVLVKYYN